MEKLNKGEDTESILELLVKLAIPVKIAEEQQLLEKLAELAFSVSMFPLCEKVAKQVNEKKEEEQEKIKKEEEDKLRKARRNERRRETYKRKKEADEAIKIEAKKIKMDHTEKTGETHQHVAVTQKPKPAAKKTTLMMKCLRDSNKLCKQYK